VRDGRVSIVAAEVSHRAVLERVARAADFTLEVSDLPRAQLSLRLDDTPLVAALPELLRGVPYRVDFAVDAATGLHRLVWLGAGSDPGSRTPVAATAEANSRRPPPQKAMLERMARQRAARAPDQLARTRKARKAMDGEREGELLRLLDDPDPSVRAEAVLELPVDEDPLRLEERMQRLAGLVVDPESVVRLAAVERLGESEAPGTLDALLPALDDTNREVVLEAIDSIEDLDDPAAIPHLKRLLQDRDPEIREDAGDAIDWLED